MAKQIVVTPNYKPHAKQVLLHNAPISFDDICITLYGGSRGGGKSAGILADAVMFCNTYPKAKCCILRESLDAVKQSFLDKLPSLFPQEVDGHKLYDYREKSSSWYPSRSIVFPNGSYITLQRVANYAEAKAKQGWEFNYLAIDEVTKQEQRTVNYLLTCVRSAIVQNPYTGQDLKIPTKVVFGCNPGGIGHKWVKETFIDPTVLKYDEHNTPIQTKDCIQYVPNPQQEGTFIKRRIRFIPASYKDNPYLNPSYVANLDSLPEHQKQLDMYGNWDVVAGKMFDLKNDQIIKPGVALNMIAAAQGNIEIIVSIDWGYKPSYYSAHWMAVLPSHKVIVFQELYGQELVFEDFVNEIKRMSDGMYIGVTCLPHDMFRHGDRYRDASGQIIGETKSDVFAAADLNPISVASGQGKVQLRYDKIHSALAKVDDDGEFRFLISTSCPNLIEELEHAVHSDIIPGMLAKGTRDHAIDDFGLFLIYYSEDIDPLTPELPTIDNRSYLQRILEEDERKLEEDEEDEFYIAQDNYYDL